MRSTNAGYTKFLAVPALVFLIVFFFYPLASLFLESVHFPTFTLQEYRIFLSNTAYIEIAARTFAISSLITLICLLLGYPAAALITGVPRKWRGLLLVCVIMPYLTSLLVRTYAWLVILSDNGILNQTLMFLSIIDEPVQLLYNRSGMIIAMVHIMLPFMILPIYSAMQSVDPALLRASRSLGGGPARSFLQIYFPQTLSGVKSGSILVFVLCLGFYITPAALGGLNDLMLSTLIEGQVNGATNFPFAAAIGFLLLAATLTIYYVLGGAQISLPGTAGTQSGKISAAGRLLAGIGRRSGLATLAARASGWNLSRKLGLRRRRPFAMPLLKSVVGLSVLLFLIAPSIIVIILSFSGDSLLSFPPSSWSVRWYESYFSDEAWLKPTLLSVEIALVSMLLALSLGVPAAYALVRQGGRWSGLQFSLFLAPIVVPLVVVGVASYGFFADIRLLGSKSGLILAHTCGGVTYVVTVVSASVAGIDSRLEKASRSLGAGPARTFRRIIAPLAMPGIVAGALFAFIHSFDEVVVSSFISGIRLRTLPLRMWEDIRNQVDPTIAAVSALLIMLPLLLLPVIQRLRAANT